MLETRKLTPAVYYNQSRDFQLLGRVCEAVFNYMKTTTDMVNKFPYLVNDKDFVDLALITVGFIPKHNYVTKQLLGILSSFTTIIKYKGTKKAIELTVKTLLKSEGLFVTDDDQFIQVDGNTVLIFISEKLSDLTLLYDILEYILPAGMSYQIINNRLISEKYSTEVYTETNINPIKLTNISVSKVPTFEDVSGDNAVKPDDKGIGRIDNISVSEGIE